MADKSRTNEPLPPDTTLGLLPTEAALEVVNPVMTLLKSIAVKIGLAPSSIKSGQPHSAKSGNVSTSSVETVVDAKTGLEPLGVAASMVAETSGQSPSSVKTGRPTKENLKQSVVDEQQFGQLLPLQTPLQAPVAPHSGKPYNR